MRSRSRLGRVAIAKSAIIESLLAISTEQKHPRRIGAFLRCSGNVSGPVRVFCPVGFVPKWDDAPLPRETVRCGGWRSGGLVRRAPGVDVTPCSYGIFDKSRKTGSFWWIRREHADILAFSVGFTPKRSLKTSLTVGSLPISLKVPAEPLHSRISWQHLKVSSLEN